MTRFDVAVVGAGPAGAVAAALLARAGASVALFDRARPGADRIGETLPSAAARALTDLGLPGPPGDARHRPVRGVISAWGGPPVIHDYLNDPDGPAWRLDRAAFDGALVEAALAAGATPVASALRELDGRAGRWRLTPEVGPSVAADFVVDATGRRAFVARRARAGREGRDPLVAVWAVGQAPTGAPGTDRTLIEADDDGWWYGAVLPDGRPVAAFHCGAAPAARFRRDPGAWRTLLGATDILAPRLDPARFANAALRFNDAAGSVSAPPAGEGWMACGDAAIAFDPIASQGLLNAVRTGAAAAAAVTAGDRARALAAYCTEIAGVWRAYARQRDAHYARLGQSADA